MFKKLFLIISCLFLAISVHADVADSFQNEYSYSFHLYYDNGQLFGDRDFKFKYDIIAEAFVQPEVNIQNAFRGEIINFAQESVKNFLFEPAPGKFSARGPYVADAEKVIFYNPQNQEILTIVVAESSFCNDDGVCNSERGEDSNSCPKDCDQSLPTPINTEDQTEDPSSSGIIWGIVYSIIGILLLIVLWWVKKRRSSDSGPQLPTSLTPPTTGNPV